jgi:hypothetical protein
VGVDPSAGVAPLTVGIITIYAIITRRSARLHIALFHTTQDDKQGRVFSGVVPGPFQGHNITG